MRQGNVQVNMMVSAGPQGAQFMGIEPAWFFYLVQSFNYPADQLRISLIHQVLYGIIEQPGARDKDIDGHQTGNQRVDPDQAGYLV